MIIREAKEDDYKDIYLLNKNEFGYDFDIDKTRIRLIDILKTKSNKIFVAEIDGKIVGYAHGSEYDCTYSEPLKNILAIAVNRTQRGKGIGRTLIIAIESWAKDTNCVGVRLVSGFDRVDAHKFYLSCGYSHRKDQKNFMKIF